MEEDMEVTVEDTAVMVDTQLLKLKHKPVRNNVKTHTKTPFKLSFVTFL